MNRYAIRARRSAQLAQPENFGLTPLMGEREAKLSGRIRNALRDKLSCDVSTTEQRRGSEQTIGMPDLFVTHAAWGVFCWMEVKRPEVARKKDGTFRERRGLSKEQEVWHEATEAAGVPVLVVTSPEDACTQFGDLPRNMALWAKRGREYGGSSRMRWREIFQKQSENIPEELR